MSRYRNFEARKDLSRILLFYCCAFKEIITECTVLSGCAVKVFYALLPCCLIYHVEPERLFPHPFYHGDKGVFRKSLDKFRFA